MNKLFRSLTGEKSVEYLRMEFSHSKAKTIVSNSFNQGFQPVETICGFSFQDLCYLLDKIDMLEEMIVNEREANSD